MVDTKQLYSGFLHAIVQSDQFLAMASISYGTHMPRTDWRVMCNFPVMLPPIPEQRAIAEALSDVDGLINALEALIAKKRAIKQATMQQLLTGKTRLPGFSGTWETKRLGEIAHIENRNCKNNEDKDDTWTISCLQVLTVRSAVVERINEVIALTVRQFLCQLKALLKTIFHYINGRFDCHQRVYMINRFVDDVFGQLI